MIIKALETLMGTAFTNDIYITVCAAIAIVVFVIVVWLTSTIKKDIKQIIKENDALYAKRLYNWSSRMHTIFITLISIFPLLGMFGTVCGLLGLDLATGDMENIKANFFIALTSTAWGIIWSVVCKIIHAFFVDRIENEISAIKKVHDELEK